MHVTNIKKSVAGCLLIITSFLLITISVLGAEQEFKSLKLVCTYQSEEDVRKAYPEDFSTIKKITKNEEWIYLSGRRLKTFEMEPLTDQEQQKVRKLDETAPVIKNGITRKLSPDHSFLLEAEVTVKMRESGYRHEGDVETKKLTLYNAQGEVVTQLASEVTSIRVSPDHRYFVTYTWNEYGNLSDILYFYDIQGSLLHTQKIIERPQVEYSQNGEFVQVYSDSEWTFAIFTNTGELVFQGNYIDLLKSVRSPLWRVYTSEQGTHMLLFTSQRLDLYTTHGEFVWTRSIPKVRVVDCWFFSTQGKIVLQTMTSRSGDDRYDLQIHNFHTGEKLEEFPGIAEMTGVNSHLIIKKEGQYYEYQIR